MTTFNPSDPEHLLGEAIYLAAGVHRYQKDKSGVNYTLHPIAVMLMDGPNYDRFEMIVRILHDTIEDFDGTPVERMGFMHKIEQIFPAVIVDALKAMTHKPKGEETYEEYIERVAQNFLARKAKIADLKHNMDPNRLPLTAIQEKDFERWHKYRKALVRLERED